MALDLPSNSSWATFRRTDSCDDLDIRVQVSVSIIERCVFVQDLWKRYMEIPPEVRKVGGFPFSCSAPLCYGLAFAVPPQLHICTPTTRYAPITTFVYIPRAWDIPTLSVRRPYQLLSPRQFFDLHKLPLPTHRHL